MKDFISLCIFVTTIMIIFYFKTGLGTDSWQYWILLSLTTLVYHVFSISVDLNAILKINCHKGETK